MLRTTNTWACIKAIPNSNAENAIMNAKGNKPKKKNRIPLVIILYVKPLKIFNNKWPATILAANLNPKDIFLARYDINSIKTNKGNNARGHPPGTNKEKNSKPFLFIPKIVAPNTIVKLIENVNIKWEVDAKL